MQWILDIFGKYGLALLITSILSWGTSHVFVVFDRRTMDFLFRIFGFVTLTAIFFVSGLKAGLISIPVILFGSFLGAGLAKSLKNRVPSKTDDTLAEEEAAKLFIYSVIRKVSESWSGMLSQFGAIHNGYKIKHLDEDDAKWEFCLAIISAELCSLKNLFPKDQATRLFELSLRYLPDEKREYAKMAIQEYNTRYEDDVLHHINPVQSMGEILHGRLGLAGDNYTTGVLHIPPDQLLCGTLAVAITSFLGVWKNIKLNLKISKNNESCQ